jgi:phosphoserine aminotransferase
MTDVTIPTDLLPSDGRFGSGPSRVPAATIAELQRLGGDVLGTSHRQEPVRQQVRRLRDGMRALFDVPDGYEVLITVGGATAFWDALAFGVVERRARHYVMGEFSGKFARVTADAPWLDAPDVVEAAPGTAPAPSTAPGCDVQAWTHNETSTGVMMTPRRLDDALVVVDATSGAGGLPLDPAEVDLYYFSLQKGFASDGGLTVALASPAALDRIAAVAASDRYVPAFLDLATVVENSRKDQTYNTPAVATIVMARVQVEAMLAEHGGLEGVVAAQRAKADHLYGWAASRAWASPFVADPADRSLVVGTIDLEGVAADDVNRVLRAHGVVDTDPYRKLGRNQLRVAFFPAVPRSDVEAYTACVDHVVAALTA